METIFASFNPYWWIVTLNPSKYQSLAFSMINTQQPVVYFGHVGEPIENVNEHCQLGLNFTSNATWNLPFNSISFKFVQDYT